MKASLPISIIALLLSILAFANSYRTPRQIDQEHLEKAVNADLIEREREFVAEVKPKFADMFEEVSDDFGEEWNPQTVEELIEPMMKIIQSIPEE